MTCPNARTSCTPRWLAFFLLAARFVLPGLAAPAELAPKRYLFLDPALLAKSQDVTLAVNPPQRRETVITPDRPWEQLMISFFLTVRDEEGKLRMWYLCRDKKNHANLAYAESKDGVQWIKPELGITEYAGNKANNLVGISSREGTPFIDPNAPPAERYVMVSNYSFQEGVGRFTSPDGLRWKRDATAILKFPSDTQNVIFWDTRLQTYVVYMRGWSPKYRVVKRVALASLTEPSGIMPTGQGRASGVKDGLRYLLDEIPTVLQCDEQDPARTDIYNMAAQPYALDPSWYVAFPAYLRRSAASDAPGYHGSHRGPVEIEFAGSRDGIAWNRYDRKAYATAGMATPDKKNMVFMGTGLIVRGDEIWQYGTEFESEHGDVAARQKKTDGVIVRYVQRVDGFVALTAGNTPGWGQTMPVPVTGERLLLNLDTGALGELRVGLVSESGEPISGFSADDCVPLQGNATGLAVTWTGGDLSKLQGRHVRLDFKLHRTKLFSFRFE